MWPYIFNLDILQSLQKNRQRSLMNTNLEKWNGIKVFFDNAMSILLITCLENIHTISETLDKEYQGTIYIAIDQFTVKLFEAFNPLINFLEKENRPTTNHGISAYLFMIFVWSNAAIQIYRSH